MLLVCSIITTLLLVLLGMWLNPVAAEKGHNPNRHYLDMQGHFHLNGSAIVLEETNASYVVPATMAGLRVLTIPDPGGNANFVLTGATQGANGLTATALRMLEWKNTDGTTLAAAASSGKFGMTITLATAAFLLGEVANTNTKTDDAIIEFVLPHNYVAGTNITVTVNASVNGAGTPGTKTAQIFAYKTASDGTQAADIGPGATSAITVAGADITFTITGTTLNPGDRLMLKLEVVLQETGGTNINAKVNSVRVS
jgi:hypothetical protein